MVTVRLVTNPDTDSEYHRRAEKQDESVYTPDEIERLLRSDYRRARVVRGVTDIVERWYVYRDGRWVNSHNG